MICAVPWKGKTPFHRPVSQEKAVRNHKKHPEQHQQEPEHITIRSKESGNSRKNPSQKKAFHEEKTRNDQGTPALKGQQKNYQKKLPAGKQRRGKGTGKHSGNIRLIPDSKKVTGNSGKITDKQRSKHDPRQKKQEMQLRAAILCHF